MLAEGLERSGEMGQREMIRLSDTSGNIGASEARASEWRRNATLVVVTEDLDFTEKGLAWGSGGSCDESENLAV